MIPFPKRHYPSDSYDIEIPVPPRSPAFARTELAPQAYAPGGHYGFQDPPSFSSSYGPMSMSARVPPHSVSYAAPPNSLAPMAMGVSDTGAHAPRVETVVIRGKPSMRWGVMIALAGALIGGALGISTNAKRDQARALAGRAAEAVAALPAAPAVVTPPPATPVVATPIVATPVVTKPVVATPGVPVVVPQMPPATPPTAFAKAPAPPATAVAAAPAKTEASTAPAAPTKAKRASHVSRGMVSTKVSVPKERPAPPEKVAEKADKPEKPEKAERAEKPSKTESPVAKTKEGSEALDLLNRAKSESAASL